MFWMVPHSAMLRNIFVVGDDGKTAWQRARGTPCNLKLVDPRKEALEDLVTSGVLDSGWALNPEQVNTSCLIQYRAGSAMLERCRARMTLCVCDWDRRTGFNTKYTPNGPRHGSYMPILDRRPVLLSVWGRFKARSRITFAVASKALACAGNARTVGTCKVH